MSKEIQRLWSRMADYGCVACKKNGIYNNYVSIHHITGRTTKGAHRRVIPLCGFHHQLGTEQDPSVHPWKAAFEAKYGKQMDLLREVMEALNAENA